MGSSFQIFRTRGPAFISSFTSLQFRFGLLFLPLDSFGICFSFLLSIVGTGEFFTFSSLRYDVH